jgi:uncharacterized protein
MLKFNLRHLEEGEIHLQGELPVAELDFGVTDEMVRAEKPLRYDLQVELLDDSLLVTGSLRLTLDCECVRCLKAFKYELQLDDWTVHLPLEGEGKVSVNNDCVDLTPFVREDTLLEFPQHPLCQPDCVGLSKKIKASEAENKEDPKPLVWVELDKLKLNN